ncbi:16389_t:CDS:2, partial [Gigaspora margarita]
PTSSEVQKNIKEYLKKCLKDIETKKKVQRYVILGDFNIDLNQIINLDLKEQAGKEKKKQIAQLLREKKAKQSIIFCKTKNMDLRTGSDHQAVVVQLETGLNLIKEKTLEEYWKKKCTNKYPRLSAIGKQNLRQAIGYYRE